MSTATNTKRIVSRVRAGLADMRYAQQRVFENRTGVAAGSDWRQTGIATTPAELEALYALEHRMSER